VVKEGNNDLGLAPLEWLISLRKENVCMKGAVLPCLEIAYTAVDKVRHIPLSGITTKRRCLHISAELYKQLLQKLEKAQSFRIHFDETTDISDEV